MPLIRKRKTPDNVFFEGAFTQIWHIIKLIGEGTFGSVYRAQEYGYGPSSKKPDVAIKVPKRLKYNSMIREEADLLLQLNEQNSPNLLRMETTYNQAGIYVIVTELCDSDLKRFASNYQHGVPLHLCNRIGQQVVTGLAAMNRISLIHRDLKPANILVKGAGEDAIIKIADHGLTTTVDLGSVEGICGTYIFMPPEQLEQRRLAYSVDTWAKGTTLMTIRRRHPLGPNYPKCIRGISRKVTRKFGRAELSEKFKRTIPKYLKKNPDDLEDPRHAIVFGYMLELSMIPDPDNRAQPEELVELYEKAAQFKP